jgi:hypothetical protein
MFLECFAFVLHEIVLPAFLKSFCVRVVPLPTYFHVMFIPVLQKELSTARELALGRLLGQAPSPDPTPSAAASSSPSPSQSPSHSPSMTVSATASHSPSPSHSSHSATKSVSVTPTASLTHGATPSASPLPAVVIKIVQSVSVFTVDQLEGHPEVVQALLQAFKMFVANSTSSVEQVRVIALIDGLTRLSTPIPANHAFNQGADDRRRRT